MLFLLDYSLDYPDHAAKVSEPFSRWGFVHMVWKSKSKIHLTATVALNRRHLTEKRKEVLANNYSKTLSGKAKAQRAEEQIQ